MKNMDNQHENHSVHSSSVGTTDQNAQHESNQDQRIPRWWKLIFVATIAFAPPYFFWHHCGAPGRTMADEYDVAMAANLKLQFGAIGDLTLDRANVVKYLYEDSWLKVGRAVFKANCVSCHGVEGGGLVGPNLCDDQYKNVKDIGDILKILQNGANGGAMPAWQNRLSANEIVLVSSYVASLRGSNPAIAKPGEGREIPAWPPAPIVTEEGDNTSGEDQEI